MIQLKIINAAKNLHQSLSSKKWVSSVGITLTKDTSTLDVYINTKLTKTIEKSIPTDFEGFSIVTHQVITEQTPKNVRY